ILAGVRAKQAGCPMALAPINDPTLVPPTGARDIDAHSNPRATTGSAILRPIRPGRGGATSSVWGAPADARQGPRLRSSHIAGRLVREIEFPEGGLMGALMKGEKVVKPTGDTRVDEGDVIALFCMSGDVPEVERLLQVSIDFF